MANKCYYALIKLFRSKSLSRQTKCNIYKTLVRPVLTYGSECWTLAKIEEESLLRFERKILRMIFGAVKLDNVWRRRYNDELYEIYKDINVVRFIKIARLRWIGHVFRRGDGEVIKRIVKQVPEGTRKVGRPRRRWQEDVENDLRIMRVNKWMQKAQIRTDWRDILKAETHPGL